MTSNADPPNRAAVPSLDQAQVAEKWKEIARVAAHMTAQTGRLNPFPVDPRSQLDRDDAVTAPFQVSHAVRICLVAACDHLHALTSLVVDLDVLHAAAPASLVRGVIENTAAAYWILNPPIPAERISRALCWKAKDFRDQEAAFGDLHMASQGDLDAGWVHLDAVAKEQSLDPRLVRKGYTSTEAVAYADQNADPRAGVLLAWRICSGIAHGRPWAYFTVSEVEESPRPDSSLVDVKLTSDLSRMLFPALAGIHLLDATLRVFNEPAASSGRIHRTGR